jgi:cytoskeletal protein RodZ
MDISGKITADIADFKNPYKRVGIGSVLWYLLAGIIIIGVIIWIVYSVSGSHERSQLIDHITKAIKDIRIYFNSLFNPSSSKSHTDHTSSSSSSSSMSTVYNPNTYSSGSKGLEQSTQTINTALNYNTPAEGSHSSGMFQNDDPDSSIQSGKNSRMSTFGWSIADEGPTTGHYNQLSDAYGSSSSSSSV